MSKKRLMANGYEFYTGFVVRGGGTKGFVYIEKTNLGLNEYMHTRNEWKWKRFIEIFVIFNKK